MRKFPALTASNVNPATPLEESSLQSQPTPTPASSLLTGSSSSMTSSDDHISLQCSEGSEQLEVNNSSESSMFSKN